MVSAPTHTFIGVLAPRCSPGVATCELHDASSVLRLVRLVGSEQQGRAAPATLREPEQTCEVPERDSEAVARSAGSALSLWSRRS